MINRIKVEITSADISGTLRLLMEKKIDLHQVKRTDDMMLTCYIAQSDYVTVQKMLTRRGAAIQMIKKNRTLHFLENFIHRPILSVGLVLLTFLSLYLPTRILFVEVEGNANLPSKQILEQAVQCGIRFGVSRKAIRSEQTKNKLLSAIPQLQWVGVNTRGCVAIISVREKSVQSDTPSQKDVVSSIVARTDGIIMSCTVQQGTALCAVGQAVKAGQVLVSGYTDCGLKIQTSQAEAEILAATIRNLEVFTPVQYMHRSKEKNQKIRFGLLIGKKLINFCKGSGISDTTCAKMYERKYMTLPGGRTLPIALVIETYCFYEQTPVSISRNCAEKILSSATDDYLSSQMIAGQVLYSNTEFCQMADGFALSGRYACSEMIGKVIPEESIYQDGKDD